MFLRIFFGLFLDQADGKVCDRTSTFKLFLLLIFLELHLYLHLQVFWSHLHHRAKLHSVWQHHRYRMCRGCKELILKVLQCLQSGIQNVTSVLLKYVKPFKDMAVHIVKSTLCGLEIRLRLQISLVCRRQVFLSAVLELFLGARELNKTASANVQADLQIAVVCNVVLHWIRDVESHISPKLRDSAMGRVSTRNLVRSLFELAAVGRDLMIGRMRKSGRYTI
mmetsp:Transcript_18516/g.30048  ORF Transcript_18516/g.30048 Transcript_18516/m.30048 type:complete len:222 (+) Transcript_18516:1240-1905(+)